MIYATCLSKETILSEQDLSFKLMTESADMTYLTLEHHINILTDFRIEYINESVVDKVKSIIAFIKKAIKKLSDLFLKFLKLYIGGIEQFIGYIPKLYKYTVPVQYKLLVPKNDGVLKMLDQVPKTAMDKIKSYINKDEDTLEKLLYNKDGDINSNRVKQRSTEMINNIISPFGLKVTEDNHVINVQYLVKTEDSDVSTTSMLIAELKIKARLYKNLLEKTNKQGKKLCDSYNKDLAEIDRMINTSAKNAEDERKDALILDLIKSEYAVLFYVASKIGKAQFDSIAFCINNCQTIINHITTNMKDGMYSNRKNTRKE